MAKVDRTTVAVPVGRNVCEACATTVEGRLRQTPGVLGVRVEPSQHVAYVEVRDGALTIGELAEVADRACGARNPVPIPDASVSSHGYAHAAMPAMREGVAAAAGEHGDMARADHAGHDMSNPNMAAAMEADMRRRFWISLVLAIPVIAYSGLGMLLFGGRNLATPFGVPMDWVMLAFATPVALWTSSVFHIGAVDALKSRVLNMNVLVSLGILTSYLFSVGLTLLAPGQETFILRPEFGALAMSASSITVVPNALLLRREVGAWCSYDSVSYRPTTWRWP